MISAWYTVNCDDCGDAGPLAETATEAVALAVEQGWNCGNAIDICPKHNRKEP